MAMTWLATYVRAYPMPALYVTVDTCIVLVLSSTKNASLMYASSCAACASSSQKGHFEQALGARSELVLSSVWMRIQMCRFSIGLVLHLNNTPARCRMRVIEIKHSKRDWSIT